MRLPQHTLLFVAVAGLAGCGGAASADKAGVKTDGAPIQLTLLDPTSNPDSSLDWVRAVERRTGGHVKLQVKGGWRDGETHWGEALLRDVQAGKAPLAIVPTGAFDEAGVTSFDPLTAPLLIDSQDVQRRVLRDRQVRETLAGVEKLGLVGLALLPGELRRPFGLSEPLGGPEDYRGLSIYTREGKINDATLRALGAEPAQNAVPDWAKDVDGAEITITAPAAMPDLARAGQLTGNVVLWPQPLAVVMRRDAFERLSPAQQRGLRAAVDDVVDPLSKKVAAREAESVGILCRLGTKLAVATPQQLSALRAAVEPVYAAIGAGTGNPAILARIASLKGQTPATTLSCPAAPQAAAQAASQLRGTFETDFTREQLAHSPLVIDNGEVNDDNWGHFTLRFTRDGHFTSHGRNSTGSNSVSGRFTTDGDMLELRQDNGEVFRVRWSLYRARLTLKRDESIGGGPTPLVIKPWTRVR